MLRPRPLIPTMWCGKLPRRNSHRLRIVCSRNIANCSNASRSDDGRTKIPDPGAGKSTPRPCPGGTRRAGGSTGAWACGFRPRFRTERLLVCGWRSVRYRGRLRLPPRRGSGVRRRQQAGCRCCSSCLLGNQWSFHCIGTRGLGTGDDRCGTPSARQAPVGRRAAHPIPGILFDAGQPCTSQTSVASRARRCWGDWMATRNERGRRRGGGPDLLASFVLFGKGRWREAERVLGLRAGVAERNESGRKKGRRGECRLGVSESFGPYR